MTSDPLQELLRRADAAAGGPAPLPGVLPDRVRRLAERRRRRNVAGGAVVAAMFATFSATWLLSSGTVSRPEGQTETAARGSGTRAAPSGAVAPDTQRLLTEIASLRAEGDLRMQIVERTRAIRQREIRLAALERELTRPDPVELARAEVEQSAATLVHQAERLHRALNLRAAAIDSYHRTIRLFPQTRSAQVARARLSELGVKQGDS